MTSGTHEPKRPGERGQALALFVLASTVIMAAAGLVVDGGMAFINRRDAQNAADLGAMAGTRVISDYYMRDGTKHSRDVWDAIDAAVQANGCTAGGTVPCSWTASFLKPAASGPGTELITGSQLKGGIPDTGLPIPLGSQGVEVVVERQPPTVLLPVIGMTQWDVVASAQAITAQIDTVPAGTLLPIAVDPLPGPNNFQPGDTHILSLGHDAPGQFSWLTWNGDSNSDTLAANICTAQNPAMDLADADTEADWIVGDVGKTNSSAVRDCLLAYKGQIIVLPTYDATRLQGSNAQFHITGFTYWRLLDFEANPHIDNIKATFIDTGPGQVGAEYAGPPCNATTDTSCDRYSFFLGLIN
ncbi:MAG: Tad domain-containing protein [Chloroflexota bacterium]|jgi:hypothetical protein